MKTYNLKDLHSGTIHITEMEKVSMECITCTSQIPFKDFTEYLCSYLEKHAKYASAISENQLPTFKNTIQRHSWFQKTQCTHYVLALFLQQESSEIVELFKKVFDTVDASLKMMEHLGENRAFVMFQIKNVWKYVAKVRHYNQDKSVNYLMQIMCIIYNGGNVFDDIFSFTGNQTASSFLCIELKELRRRQMNGCDTLEFNSRKLCFLASLFSSFLSNKMIRRCTHAIVRELIMRKNTVYWPANAQKAAFHEMSDLYFRLRRSSFHIKAFLLEEGFVDGRTMVKILTDPSVSHYLNDDDFVKTFAHRQIIADAIVAADPIQNPMKLEVMKGDNADIIKTTIITQVKTVENDILRLEDRVTQQILQCLFQSRGEDVKTLPNDQRDSQRLFKSASEKIDDILFYMHDYLLLCSLYRVSVGILPYDQMEDLFQGERLYDALVQSNQHDDVPWCKPLLFSVALYCIGRSDAIVCSFFDEISPSVYERASGPLISGIYGLHSALNPDGYFLNVRLEIDYNNQYDSLISTISHFTFNPRFNFYNVVFYEICEGVKCYHAGIDAKGLQRSLVQTCIDTIMNMPYVCLDEEGKIYVDFCHQSYNDSFIIHLSIFLTFILSQEQDYHFPLREELIRFFGSNQRVKNQCDVIERQLLCERLEPSQEQCLINMKGLVEKGQMSLEEYEENVTDIVAKQNVKFRGQNTMCDTRIDLQGDYFMGESAFFTMGHMLQKLHSCAAVKSNDELIKKLDLYVTSKDQIKAANDALDTLKLIVLSFSEQERKRFIVLVHGANVDIKSVRVCYIDKVILPMWQTCATQITLGREFDRKKLMMSMSVEGFYLV